MTDWMITGSSTDDGAPIYWTQGGRWTREFGGGAVLSTDESREAALVEARAQERLVCDPYAIEVTRDAAGQPAPSSLKQRIRAEGPTVPLVGASTHSPSARRRAASA